MERHSKRILSFHSGESRRADAHTSIYRRKNTWRSHFSMVGPMLKWHCRDSSRWPLRCFGLLPGSPRRGRIRLRLRLLLRGPISLHSFRLLFALRGRECTRAFLGRLSGLRSGGTSDGQRSLRWSSSARGRSLKSFNRSIQLVSFCNQKYKNLFCRHRRNLNSFVR